MKSYQQDTRKSHIRFTVLGFALFALSACDDTGGFNPGSMLSSKPETSDSAPSTFTAGDSTEKDVEAPEVFETTEAGLWDGRPSLGGIWVAHPDVDTPERVRIRNQANGQTVVGALFRRERETPGPRLQISSEAAQALGVLAGAPVSMEVVALRKEVVAPPEPAPEPETEAETAASEVDTAVVEAPADVTETELAPAEIAAAAVAATQSSEGGTNTRVTPVSTLPETTLGRPYLQAAVFTGEDNAQRAVAGLKRDGLEASARSSQSSGKEIWRVVVGPMTTVEERNAALEKVKAAGFSDAYPVSQ